MISLFPGESVVGVFLAKMIATEIERKCQQEHER